MAATFTDKKGAEHSTPEPLAPLADTHGHLTHFRHTDAAAAIVRAARAGVKLLVVPVDPVDEFGPGKRFEDVPDFLAWFDKAMGQARAALGTAMPELRLVAGVHPYGADDPMEEAGERLDALLESPLAVGVGEFGFDFGPWAKLGPEVQEEAFLGHLAIASELGLPAQLHLRDPEKGEPIAHIMAERILREAGVPEAGCVLHCFTEGPEIMDPFVELGCHIAFGGAATFASSDDIRAAAAACPSELILSETDSPYMAPVPLRGCECEPGMVSFTAALLAEVREEAGSCSRQETYDALWRNAEALFL